MSIIAKDIEIPEASYALHPDLVDFIAQALEEEDAPRIHDLTADMHAADLAELVSIISCEQRAKLIHHLRENLNPQVLIDLEEEIKDEVILLLGAKDTAAAIAQLDSDDAVHVMEDLEKEEQEEILEEIPEDKRDLLKESLSYPEGSAGRIMNASFVAIPENWDVGRTIDHLREHDELPDDFYEIFIVNPEQHPVGSVLVSRVLRRNREIHIRNLVSGNLRTIGLMTDQEEIAYIFQKYALASAPVIDNNGKVVGVISVDDIADIIEKEAEEDIMHMGGVDRTDLYSSYIQTAMHRSPWLFVNLLTAIAASGVIAMFAESIEKLVALAVLMPIVASMAGNAGTQTLTIAVRSIATKELTETNAIRVILKEISASLINGVIFGLTVGICSFIYYGDLHLSLIFASAMFIALVMAAFAGAIIPLAMTRFGADPAVSSVVFLTTVTDVTAFFVFLGLAAWMLV